MPFLQEIGSGFKDQDPNKHLDNVVKQVNDWGRRISGEKTLKLIKSETTTITGTGAAIDTLTIAHGLDFAPVILAYMNNSSISNNGVLLTSSANIPLPGHFRSNIDTTNNRIDFRVWLYAITDATNVYIIMLNSTGLTTVPITIKYDLLQEIAN